MFANIIIKSYANVSLNSFKVVVSSCELLFCTLDEIKSLNKKTNRKYV